MFVSNLYVFVEMSVWPIFLIGSFTFLELSCMSCSYIFEINSLLVSSFATIFSHSEVDQPWDFFGRNDAKAPVLWPPRVKS